MLRPRWSYRTRRGGPRCPDKPHPTATSASCCSRYIAQQRDGLRFAAYGLTDEQARLHADGQRAERRRARSSTSRRWSGLDRPDPPAPGRPADEAQDELRGRVPPRARPRRWPTRCAELDAVAAARPRRSSARTSISTPPCPCPRACRGSPTTSTPGPCAGCCCTSIEEIARHAGHADIVRESIDGATMYELMAGAEGWPATDWLQPWTAPAPVAA